MEGDTLGSPGCLPTGVAEGHEVRAKAWAKPPTVDLRSPHRPMRQARRVPPTANLTQAPRIDGHETVKVEGEETASSQANDVYDALRQENEWFIRQGP